MSKQPTSLLSLAPFATTSTSRLQALYSDISRKRRSNPVAYHASIDWWRHALESIVSHGLQEVQAGAHPNGRLVLHAGRSLVDRFKVEGVGKPLALGAVIYELSATDALISLSSFLSSKRSIYDPGWLPARIAAFVVGKPLWWTLEQLGFVGEDGFIPSGQGSRGSHDNQEWFGEYVFVTLLEQAAKAVVEKQRSKAAGPADQLYNFDSFKNEFGSVLGQNVLDDKDVFILLKFLDRDFSMIVIDDEVIKFVDKYASTDERQISPVDRGILELKTAILNLHTQIDSLQQRVDEYTRRASDALRQQRKPMSLNYLRSRKQLEELNKRRLGSLHTLESTLISVEAAAGDIEIMKVYGSSTATLRVILAHPSLQRESIDRTMDALAEANSDAKEIDEAIRTGTDAALNIDEIDDAELEMELNRLIADSASRTSDEEHLIVKGKLGEAALAAPQHDIAERTARVPAV
ncbi:hypothetical protein AX17_002836 [Amanita inopinata Kibby_2008]|nr:hypothetical protein AX17_002836 [Amanita inopinata Kibby_2008]